MKKTIIALALCLTACGNDTQGWTWGDGVSIVIDAFCAKQVECGVLGKDREKICREHSYYHLCEMEESCDFPQGKEEADRALACASAIQEWEGDNVCFEIFFGVTPAECDPFWETDPVVW